MNSVNNLNTAITLLLSTISKAQEISAKIGAARAEGRDLTAAELASLQAADDAARAGLVAAIGAAQS